jgi:hypothetical protein
LTKSAPEIKEEEVERQELLPAGLVISQETGLVRHLHGGELGHHGHGRQGNEDDQKPAFHFGTPVVLFIFSLPLQYDRAGLEANAL